MNPWQLRRRRRLLALWAPLVVITIVSAVTGMLLWQHVQRTASADERFRRAWDGDEYNVAEDVAWRVVRSRPNDLAWWIRFTVAHAELAGRDKDDEGAPPSVVSERAVREQLAKIGDPKAAAIERFWYASRMKEDKADALAVVRLADARPPARYANFVLARDAWTKKEWRAAAARFEREGLAFGDGRERNLWSALMVFADHDDWQDLRKRINDRRYAEVVDAALRVELAVHEHDWLGVLLWVWPATYVHVTAWAIGLALLAAVLWFRIATRLGRVRDAVPGRVVLYAAAFGLGVLSIYPTLVTAMLERSLGLRELGQFVPDLIYYTFGVGLREEAWKAILFLPLLPALLRRGSRIEAMTCGALVGLGFAAEENISYFVDDGAAAALPRFLTANFLHMSLTALVALAAFDSLRKRATARDAFNVVFPLAVAIHGAYDFCLTTNDMPLSSIFSLVLMMVIAQRFLRQLLIASSREEERDVLNLLVASITLIVGASYVYASTIAGPVAAVSAIALGGLSCVVVIYMFVRELSG